MSKLSPSHTVEIKSFFFPDMAFKYYQFQLFNLKFNQKVRKKENPNISSVHNLVYESKKLKL